MTKSRPFTMIAALIFLLIALVHAYRLAVGIPITVGNAVIGQGISWAGLVIAGGLSLGLFREARR
jgi:hypothetical protein